MRPLLLIVLLAMTGPALIAQDTLRVTLQEFVERGLERSGQVQYEEGAVHLAENRVDQARASRILPNFNLNTNHGLIPGVKSDDPNLSPSEYYLDPNLSNDFEDWAIFTRAELEAVQPVYTWGAIDKAIRAAEYGAEAAKNEFIAKQKGFELQLFELYYSNLLAIEIERILNEAESTIRQVGEQIETMREEGDPNLREKDVFQFEIYTSEFEIQKTEVRQSLDKIERIWRYVLGGNASQVFLPQEDFLDPVPFEVQPFDYYQARAMEERPELRGVEAGMEALRYSVESTKARNLPSLYLGLTASFANTPNRPRQSNPFIINNTNFLTAGFGFGIRQNLNFSSARNRVQRQEIEYKRIRDLRDALSDGIMLELNEQYMDAVVADTKVEQTEEALITARQWVRHEQLNYDYGFGNAEDLIDSVRRELELRVELKQNIFEMNTKVAALYNAAGLPVTRLTLN